MGFHAGKRESRRGAWADAREKEGKGWVRHAGPGEQRERDVLRGGRRPDWWGQLGGEREVGAVAGGVVPTDGPGLAVSAGAG